jgi:hypothetical protein
MPEVDVDAGRVDAVLDPERAVLADGSLELLEEFGLRDDLLHAALEDVELFGDLLHAYPLDESVNHGGDPAWPQ